jgi:hypothetical chaperone protein
MIPLAYGIDFGTTNSVLSIAYDDRTEVMAQLGMSLLRSVVYLDAAGTRTAGEQSLKQFLSNPDLSRARVILDLKASLADERFHSTHIFGHAYDLADLTSIVFRYLKLLGDRATGSDTRRAVIGFPVAFPDTLGDGYESRQSLALDRLCTAATLAGFDEVVPLEEPAAAATGEDAELYVALDFGGGTFDVAVIRQGPEHDEVLALSGAPIGGERFTAMLFEAVVSPELNLDHEKLPARYRGAVQSLPKVLEAIFEADFSPQVFREYAPLYQRIREAGFLFDLYAAVEDAKVQLSEAEEVTVRLNKRGFESLGIPVHRSDFEAVIREPVLRTITVIERALKDAHVESRDVELVTLTGGSSRIPLFRSSVRQCFSEARIEDRDPFGRVAEGLGDQARSYPW